MEIEAQERLFANRDHALLNLQNREKEEAKGSSAPSMEFPATEPSLPVQSTDPGWLQADYSSSSFDPLPLDYFLSYENPILASVDFSDGTHVLVTCSSSNFPLVPKCYSSLAILAI